MCRHKRSCWWAAKYAAAERDQLAYVHAYVGGQGSALGRSEGMSLHHWLKHSKARRIGVIGASEDSVGVEHGGVKPHDAQNSERQCQGVAPKCLVRQLVGGSLAGGPASTSRCRSSRRSTLPAADFGRSDTNSKLAGTLYPIRRSRQYALISD